MVTSDKIACEGEQACVCGCLSYWLPGLFSQKGGLTHEGWGRHKTPLQDLFDEWTSGPGDGAEVSLGIKLW